MRVYDVFTLWDGEKLTIEPSRSLILSRLFEMWQAEFAEGMAKVKEMIAKGEPIPIEKVSNLLPTYIESDFSNTIFRYWYHGAVRCAQCYVPVDEKRLMHLLGEASIPPSFIPIEISDDEVNHIYFAEGDDEQD